MDNTVGTNIGATATLPEGQGLSETFGQSQATNVGIRLLDQEGVARKARAKQVMADRDAALGKIQKLPDFWYKHNAAIQPQFEAHTAEGVRLMAAGINDPFASTDPRAVEFQKKHMALHQMAASSKQVQGMYEKVRADIDGSKADDYDPESIIAISNFFDQPLDAIVSGSATPPALLKKKPFTETFQNMGKAMSEWERSRQTGEPNDNEVYEFAVSSVMGAADRENVIKSYGSRLAQSDEGERRGLEDRAKAAHREPWQQMAFEDAKMYQRQKAPFAPLELLASGAKTVEAGSDVTGYSTPDKFSKGTSVADAKRNADTVAAALLSQDSRWVDYYNTPEKMPRMENETDGAYRARVKSALSKEVYNLASINRESGLTEKGQGTAERRASRNEFIRHMRGGDLVQARAASRWLLGNTFGPGLKVEGVEVLPAVQVESIAPIESNFWNQQPSDGNVLVMRVTTNMSTSQIEEQVKASGWGNMPVAVTEGQGDKIVTFGLGSKDIANQSLAQLYDTQFARTKENYQGNLSESLPKTAAEFLAGKVNVPLIDRPDNGPKFK